MWRYVVPFVLLSSLAVEGSAQTIYKCSDGGGVSYSSSPCSGKPTKELHFVPPSPEQRAAAQRAIDDVQRQVEQQNEWSRIRREAELAARVQQPPPSNASRYQPTDPSLNEKVMVHTRQGWDYKTRGQLIAEEEARAARRSGAASPATAPATRTDQYGNTWLNQGGTAFNPATGRRCDQVGGQLVNCR